MGALTADWDLTWGGTSAEHPLIRREELQGNSQSFPEPVEESWTAEAKWLPGTSGDPSLNRVIFSPDDESSISKNIAPNALSEALLRLNGLMGVTTEDDDVAATEYAYQAARAVIESTYGRLKDVKSPILSHLPYPVLTIDDRGGYRFPGRRARSTCVRISRLHPGSGPTSISSHRRSTRWRIYIHLICSIGSIGF